MEPIEPIFLFFLCVAGTEHCAGVSMQLCGCGSEGLCCTELADYDHHNRQRKQDHASD